MKKSYANDIAGSKKKTIQCLAVASAAVASMLALTWGGCGPGAFPEYQGDLSVGSFYQYVNNPVMTVGAAGTYDSKAISGGSPVSIGKTQLRMYYSAMDGLGIKTIGSALSADGILWVKESQPVITPTVSSYDSNGTVNPSAIFNGTNQYAVAFMAIDSTDHTTIGIATSSDGKAFAKSAKPILEPEGDIEAGGIMNPALIYIPDNKTFYLYYTALNASGVGCIRLATSTDLATFKKVQEPVLVKSTEIPDGGALPFDAMSIMSPTVLRTVSPEGRTLLRMWYSGVASASAYVAIGLAGSDLTQGNPMGSVWQKFNQNPVANYAQKAGVVAYKDNYYMYYTTVPEQISTSISVAARIALPVK